MAQQHYKNAILRNPNSALGLLVVFDIVRVSHTCYYVLLAKELTDLHNLTQTQGELPRGFPGYTCLTKLLTSWGMVG